MKKFASVAALITTFAASAGIVLGVNTAQNSDVSLKLSSETVPFSVIYEDGYDFEMTEPPVADAPIQSSETAASVVDTPIQPSETSASVVDTPIQPSESAASVVDTPTQPSETAASVVDAPTQPSETDASVVDTPTQPSETAAPVVDTPTQPSETAASVVDTPIQPSETDASVVDTPAQPSETDEIESMVWIPKSGKKYHAKSSCSNMKNPSQVTVTEAQQRGFEPCKKCYR